MLVRPINGSRGCPVAPRMSAAFPRSVQHCGVPTGHLGGGGGFAYTKVRENATITSLESMFDVGMSKRKCSAVGVRILMFSLLPYSLPKCSMECRYPDMGIQGCLSTKKPTIFCRDEEVTKSIVSCFLQVIKINSRFVEFP